MEWAKDWVKRCVNLRGYINEKDVPIHFCALGISLSKGCPAQCSEFVEFKVNYMGGG